MVGAAIFGLIAGLYYYMPMMSGKMYHEGMANWHFTISFIGFNVLYFPMFFLYDMPRRIYTYQSLPSWNTLNLVSTIGGFIFAAAQILLLANIIWTARKGRSHLPTRGVRRRQSGSLSSQALRTAPARPPVRRRDRGRGAPYRPSEL